MLHPRIAAFILALALAIIAIFTDMAITESRVEQVPQTNFTYQACPDCLVMHVNYIPPKP